VPLGEGHPRHCPEPHRFRAWSIDGASMMATPTNLSASP
jgi:hypothetical protein